ncbi:tRNA-dihydrouridine synthase [Candidatus Peregrinibacteria bacterium]|nr:tRNA-dihydrouridine synthase [Candidatus Peregrinibacteria bacterium]
MNKNFWTKLDKPILGLSPMDGVTDAAFRYMTAKTSQPDVIYTEFVNVEGLTRGAVSMLDHFIYNKIERPVVAQIYGIETESFYKVALMCCYLGFDGIDINMGCPANKVARRNSGAGLIRVPEQAKKIIRTVKQAVQDWADGITLKKADIRPKIINTLQKMYPLTESGIRQSRQKGPLPISVKTRTGIDKVVAEEWVKELLSESPALITLHGRTLKQLYSGEANWELIGKIAKIVKKTDTLFLGNGDVQSVEDARQKCETYGTDGVLVGRATCGNPWFFSGQEPTMKERFKTAVDHARCFEELSMKHAFFAMRKHLAWYCRGFDGARELRKELMQTNSSADVEKTFRIFLKTQPL